MACLLVFAVAMTSDAADVKTGKERETREQEKKKKRLSIDEQKKLYLFPFVRKSLPLHSSFSRR
jgi:hypothetical protein